MSRVDVRAYLPADRDAVRDISFRTGFMGESAARFWQHADSWADVWTSYYTDREPESLSVAMIDETVVGYLAGCLDTAAMSPTATSCWSRPSAETAFCSGVERRDSSYGGRRWPA